MQFDFKKYKIPKRKVSKAGSFVIGRFDPNKKQTLPRGYGPGGYAGGVYGAQNGNAVGFPMPNGTAGAMSSATGGAGGAMGESIEEKHLYKFGCLMIPMSASTDGIMDEWTRNNIPEESLIINPDTGMEGYEPDHHLTVLYGIHKDDPSLLDDMIEPMFPLAPIRFGKVSKFDNQDVDVIKVEVILDEQLKRLHDLVIANVEHTEVHPEYIPHVTLAYVKKGLCDDIIGLPFFADIIENPVEFLFVNRDGEENVWEGDVNLPIGTSIEVTE